MHIFIRLLFTCLLATFFNQSYGQQQPYYPSGQAVFVQQPYNSTVYTDYNYNPRRGVANRLPNYTTNQAVFVQQPYGGAQQVVAPYPSRNRYSRPYSESGYVSPANYPSTVDQAYPFATVRSYTSSPYSTTVQNPSYNYNQPSTTYTSTQTYPFTTTKVSVPVEPPPGYYPSGSYRPYTSYQNYAYPTSPDQSAYPLTVAPETATPLPVNVNQYQQPIQQRRTTSSPYQYEYINTNPPTPQPIVNPNQQIIQQRRATSSPYQYEYINTNPPIPVTQPAR